MMLFKTAAAIATAMLCIAPSAVAQNSDYGKSDCLMENCAQIQSGYLDGYNFDPSVVGSPSFGMLFNTQLGGSQILAQPLTYTPADGKQRVIVADTGNGVYSIDATTGVVLTSRNLGAPFTSVDANCPDVQPVIGVVGTPVVDPSSNTVYMWSKTYAPGTTSGNANGRYRFYALDATTLATKFVSEIHGTPASNRPDYTFNSGVQFTRMGLLLAGEVVYAGFASHCDNGNYAGWVIGMSATDGSVQTAWVTQAGPHGTTGAGIWEAGAALSYDASTNSVWFATGNGDGQELTTYRPGSQVPGALSMSAVRATLNPFTPVDFFTPSNYQALNQADSDLGSTGVSVWDVSFLGGKINKLAVTGGKNAAAYVCNAQSLGGFKTGSGGGDNVLQIIPLNGISLSTPGYFPVDGYAYFSANGQPTRAYKLGLSDSGIPLLTKAGQTNEAADGNRGVGHIVTTSYKGQPGSGILWVTDMSNGNLRAYAAVPNPDGTMKTLFKATLPAGGIKYQRSQPGNGKMYVVSTAGTLAAFGSPVNLPLQCNTSPFGQVIVGNKSTVNVLCTTTVQTQISGTTISDATVAVSGFPQTPTAQLAANTTFSFNVTWTPTKPSTLSAVFAIKTVNSKAGYVTSIPVTFRGTSVSLAGVLQFSTSSVQFGGVVPGSKLTPSGVSQTISLNNNGLQNITILSYNLATIDLNSDDDDDAGGDPTPAAGPNYMTLSGINNSGAIVIPGQGSITVTANFNPTEVGDYGANFTVASTGGTGFAILSGTAASAGIFTYYTSQYSGPQLTNVPYMDFGNVAPGTQLTLNLNVANTGDSPIVITKSKPPVGPQITAQNPLSDFNEGDSVAPGTVQHAPVVLNVSPRYQVNYPPTNFSGTWVLNTDDPSTVAPTFVQMSARLSTRSVGPLLPDGTPRFVYLGCYPDAMNKRALPQVLNAGSATNSNGACQQLGANANQTFVGTEYGQECYSSLYLPTTNVTSDDSCTMACAADSTQICGDASFLSVFYDSLAWNATAGAYLPGKAPPPPPSVQAVVLDKAGNTWNAKGCWSDKANARSLPYGPYTSTTSMTPTFCANYCAAANYTLAAVEYSQECFCGNAISSASASGQAGCTNVCTGSGSYFCGGSSLLNVYSKNVNGTVPINNGTGTGTGGGQAGSGTGGTPPPPPSGTVGPWSYAGCYQDAAATGGILTAGNLMSRSDTMTLETCQAACTNVGGNTFGTENGNECFCSSQGLNNNAVQAAATDCATPCSGNSSEVCGGAWRLSVYSTSLPVRIAPQTATKTSIAGASFIGCFPDSIGARALSTSIKMPTYGNSVENCAVKCQGYQLFGVEYSSECFCGNTNANPTAANVQDCNYACSGDITEFCGGSGRLGLYQFSATNATTSVTTSTSTTSTTSTTFATSTSTTSTSTSPTSAPTSTSTSASSTSTSTSTSAASGALPSGIVSVGCLTDQRNQRTLPTLLYSNSSNTPATCASGCSAQGYRYSGTEYGTECYCANSVFASSSPVTGCATACPGDKTQICGGSSRISVAQDTKWKQKLFTVQAFSRFSFTDCIVDTTNSRALPTRLYNANLTMTLEGCLTACASNGYQYCGVEYGQECWAGNFTAPSPPTSAPSVGSPNSLDRGCSYPCTGNSSEACGGSNRLNLYTWLPTAEPVNPSQAQIIK